MNWEEFIQALNKCLIKFYSSMDTGARMCVLMGDIKRNGKCYSMLKDIATVGTLENIVIKMQHNCVSDSRSYSNNNFIPIVHEYIMILKKISPYLFDITYTKKYQMDIRNSIDATWREVVFAALTSLGGSATLDSIYKEIAPYKKAQKAKHYKEKIRQVLQMYDLFCSTSRGLWQIA